MNINESWEKIEHWLEQYAPTAALPRPATTEDLEQLHVRLGFELPLGVRQSLLRHNGSGLVGVIPVSFTLHSIEKIADSYLNPTPGLHQPATAPHIVAIGALGRTELIVDVNTGRLGNYDVEFSASGYEWEEDALWSCLSSALGLTANTLASPPPWVVLLPDDEEFEITHQHPDFPGKLHWTEDYLPG